MVWLKSSMFELVLLNLVASPMMTALRVLGGWADL